MAMILPFIIRRRLRPPLPAAQHGASIIIFPGVRYEASAKAGKRGDAPDKRKGKT